MKRYKRIVVLLAVLAVACVATFTVSQYQEYKEEIETSDEVILEIDPESVTTLSWSIDGQSLDFHKDETWLYDGDEAFPVDDEKITELLDQFSEFGVYMLLSVGSSISNFSSNSFVTEPLIDISYLSSTATPYKEALSISATSSLQQRISNSFPIFTKCFIIVFHHCDEMESSII